MASPKGIRAGRAFVELGVSDKLTAGLRRAQRRLKAFGEGVRAIGVRVALAGAAAVTALGGAVRVFIKAGDELEKMSRRTGLSVESLSELGFAAEQSGADLETVEKGVRTMQRAINDLGRGLSTQVDAFGALGLSMADLAGLSPEEQFKHIAERLSRVEDATKRAAIAQQIFGRAGTRLLPLMEEGAAGIEALQEEARKLGLTISGETAKDAARLTDALNVVRRVLRQAVFVIGSALAPVVEDLAERLTRIVVVSTDWIKRNKALVVTAAKVAVGAIAIGAALIALGLLLALVGAAFGGLAAIVAGVGAALTFIGSVLGALLTPIGLAVVAVVGLGIALLRSSGAGAAALEYLGEQFEVLRGVAGRTLQGIADALAAGDIPLAAKVLWAGLRLLWLEGTADLSRIWLRTRAFFVSTAQSMWFGAVAAAQIALHGLEVAWIETTAFLSKTWTRFSGGIQKIWNGAVSFVAKRILEIQGLFDRSLDVEAAKRQVDEDLERRLAEIDEGAREALAQRERARERQRRESRELNEATLEQLARDFA